jgi:aryl-alcohol dehydrogenase-like predicted oxidoreductase
MDRHSVIFKRSSVDGASHGDDISTRGGENAKRIVLDLVTILAAQMHRLGSMAKAHDAEYCTHGRDKDVGMRLLEESLTRVQTDHRDICQIHQVIYESDPKLKLTLDAEALLEAKQRSLLARFSRTMVQPR